ncbi:LytS/YhcK type 5TM receptor domain-containing protein [Caldisericum exile]|uniref:histidine kinase n=1 Tax=Caldisericum exile (strain DSM 21853 / NBRC 104410 / AZM16c01) TaxID=511051 RepID=A0A7U6JGS2_CALEA|nr:LytS/YhcK type 5TM receptor domain-containing protein [Caldisericum exile]BAL80707.1 two-component system sensor histidine kinase [Caldisericum exile AZM16c01]
MVNLYLSKFSLYVWLFQSLTVIITVAFLLTQTPIARSLFNLEQSVKKQIYLGIFFGFISILGTLLGVQTHDAVANIRDIGAITGGLFGGPIVGLIAGLMGGVHRASLGGFTGNSCALATILNGIFAGLLYTRKKEKFFSPLGGFIFAALAESFHMILVLLISPPFNKAIELIKEVSGPMISANAVGVGLFLLVIRVSFIEKEIVSAITSEKVLKITEKTLPILSKGLTPETADETVKVILENTNLDAVGITDTEKILAFRGIGSDHHKPLSPILTTSTQKALTSGKIVLMKNEFDVGCSVKECPLSSGVVVPLKDSSGNVFGVLKLYRKERNTMTPFDVEMAIGLANILSLQVELNKLETEKKMKTFFQLKALQSRINPHFLFNSLNTINYVIRSDPNKGRELIQRLSFILRKTIDTEETLSTLEEEIDLVKAYLEIEKERFKDRLHCEFNIDSSLYDVKVPALILQPVVENAVKHGFSLTKRNITIKVSAYRRGNYVYITIEDNGRGINEETLETLFDENKKSLGIRNVRDRIMNLYGNKAIFKIKSAVNVGTKVIIGIPHEGVPNWILERLSSMTKNLQGKR